MEFNISLSGHQVDLAVVVCLIAYSAASLLSAIYYRVCLKRHTGVVQASVTLILPLTGHQENLKNLLKLLDLQSLRPKRLVIAIESEDDLAFALATSLVPAVSFPVSIVIAGISTTSSQKCHNVLAAARALRADDDLMIAEYAAKKEYRILNRRVLLVPSIPPATAVGVWKFVVRQFQIIKTYRPNLWRFAAARAVLLVTAWFTLSLLYHDAVVFYGALTIIVLLLLMKQLFSMSIASSLGYQECTLALLKQCGLIILRPVIDIFILFVLCRSMHSSVVRWSHVTYRVLAPNVIQVQSRIDSNMRKSPD